MMLTDLLLVGAVIAPFVAGARVQAFIQALHIREHNAREYAAANERLDVCRDALSNALLPNRRDPVQDARDALKMAQCRFDAAAKAHLGYLRPQPWHAKDESR